MRVVIVGLGKSGTTALYYTVAAAMPRGTVGFFEPKAFPPEAAGQGPVLVKVLTTPQLDWKPFREFDKRIFILRDPRDRLVSFVLYTIYNHAERIPDADLHSLRELVLHKEAACREVGLWQISQAIERITGRDHRSMLTERHAVALRILREDPSLHRVRYERMVAGDLGELSQYLGLPLVPVSEVPRHVRRVQRTRGAGDWQNWFTPEDIEYFRPALAGAMEAFGYADEWTLAERPRILPEHGSEYLRRLLDERHAAPPSPWARLRRAALGYLRKT